MRPLGHQDHHRIATCSGAVDLSARSARATDETLTNPWRSPSCAARLAVNNIPAMPRCSPVCRGIVTSSNTHMRIDDGPSGDRRHATGVGVLWWLPGHDCRRYLLRSHLTVLPRTPVARAAHSSRSGLITVTSTVAITLAGGVPGGRGGAAGHVRRLGPVSNKTRPGGPRRGADPVRGEPGLPSRLDLARASCQDP
jgi:hypothetical protein